MIRKIAFLLIFLILTISLVACKEDDLSLSFDTSSQESVETTSNQASNDEASSEDESSVIEDSSQEESNEEESSEEETKTDTPPTQVTESGNFSTEKETVKSADRLKQMQNSKSVYNIGSDYTEKDIEATKSSADKIVLGGSLSYKNAAGFMKHYLEGSGDDYTIDMVSLLQDATALQNRNQDINKALRACENLAKQGESISVYQVEESIFHNLSGDWRYALGSYFSSIEITNLTYDGTIYSATIKYQATDFYNWDENDDNPVFTGAIAYIVGEVSPKDLHQLHRVGEAQEFLSVGEITYEISWIYGQNIENITLN